MGTKEKEKLTCEIKIRVSIKEKNTIKLLSDLYAGGNMSAYIIDRVLYSNRRVIKESNFELSKRKIKKGTD